MSLNVVHTFAGWWLPRPLSVRLAEPRTLAHKNVALVAAVGGSAANSGPSELDVTVGWGIQWTTVHSYSGNNKTMSIATNNNKQQ